MFFNCRMLTSLNLSKFITSNVNSMSGMFYLCKKLVSLDLSHFDTSQVIYMGSMFRECSLLISLNLGNFNTSKVTVMDNMFRDCLLLTSLNLSNFASPSLVMDNMFYGCKNLEYINMLQFTNNINTIPSLGLIGYKDMFYNVPDNIVICIKSNNDIILNELNQTKCYNIDCSDSWKLNQNKKISIIKICLKNCINIIDNENKIKCYENCTNEYFHNNSICKCNLDKCLLCPPNGFYNELCSICNINYYPKENDELNSG